MSNAPKINDLSQSGFRKRFLETDFVPETNYAVAMGRVSTKKQKGEAHYSDRAQLQNIQDYIESNSLNLIREPWDVAETASKHERRKNFLEMIEYIKRSQDTKKPVKHVIFSHQSRSDRNRESARELETLLKHGVTLHFARDRRKLSHQSDLEELLLWDVNNILNEKQIKDHTKNVIDGMIGRIEMGLFPGKAPFGYRNYRPSEKDLSIFVVDPGPAEYMKTAFDLFSTGLYSESQLWKELEGRFVHVPKRPGLKRFGVLLRNPFYYGDFYFDHQLHRGNPEYHPRLISHEVWQRVQDILAGRYNKRVRERTLPYLGLIRCGGVILADDGTPTEIPCGCTITAEEKRKKMADGSIKLFYYYHCGNTTRRCSQRDKGYLQAVGRKKVNYSEAEIEMLFEKVFTPFSFADDVCQWMQDHLRQEHEQTAKDHYQHLSALQARYKMLEKYIDQAYEDKLNGTIGEALWRNKNGQWLTQQEQIKREIDAIGENKQESVEKGVALIELTQKFETIYENGTPEEKRQLVEFVSSNHVLKNGSIEFKYESPFDLLVEGASKDKWWTRGESNSRPKAIDRRNLHAQSGVLIGSEAYPDKLLRPSADFCFACRPSARGGSLSH